MGLLLAGLGVVQTVPAGQHRPFYPVADQEAVAVAAFGLDATPVTAGEYLQFVQAQPQWRRDRVRRVFADAAYLDQWSGPSDLGAVLPGAPVTQVSWHAARAFCASKGGRLPTVTEWEFAADATPTAPHGARSDPATLALVLAWYGRGDQALGPVGQGPANVHGLQDLHGLVWEWTEDFNSLLIAADPRESGDADRTRFCGSGAISALDPADYASFMRFAFRSSLKADFTTRDLGFRCAYSLD